MALDVAPTQERRSLQLSTKLGGDVFVPVTLTGEENLSGLFEFHVGMASTKTSVSSSDMLGSAITLSVANPQGKPRHLSGVVIEWRQGDLAVSGLRNYEAIIAPKLWLLTQTSDNRIFQGESTLDIAEKLFAEISLRDYRTSLSKTPPKRDYCVQYRETGYDFLTRILAEEGIFFYFEHGAGKHTLVLSDSAQGYGDSGERHRHAPASNGETISIKVWKRRSRIVSGAVTVRDYDFEQPTSDLTSKSTTTLSEPSLDGLEIYEYPGLYTRKDEGQSISRHLMEAQEARHQTVFAQSNAPSLTPGLKFLLERHEAPGESGKSYIPVRIKHEARDATHLGNLSEPSYYKNDFEAVPAEVVFRPAPKPRSERMHGLQTATVVGPKGEDVYADKYGRIKVQFHWDRTGKRDENSSCWIRCAQMIAGPGWGSQFIPRIGMEVVVSFLDGDPDRPLVIGSVVNAQKSVVYAGAGLKEQSGIKTRSTPSGSASTYNELRFDDKKDKEEVYLRAQRDLVVDVTHDEARTIDNEQKLTVKKKRSITVSEGDEIRQLDKGSLKVTIAQGGETREIKKGNLSVSLDKGNALIECAAGEIKLSAGTAITLSVGSNSIKITQSGITLKGVQISETADGAHKTKAAMLDLQGSGTVTVKGGIVKIN